MEDELRLAEKPPSSVELNSRLPPELVKAVSEASVMALPYC